MNNNKMILKKNFLSIKHFTVRTKILFSFAQLVILFFIVCTYGKDLVAQSGIEQYIVVGDDDNISLTESGASHFANLALNCMQKEYPNKLGQVLKTSEDLKPPVELHPAFYGCFDWHSSVHGHWMLVKLLKIFPDISERETIILKLRENISRQNILGEVAYFEVSSASFERTYGWTWLMQLALELKTWDSPIGIELSENLQPLVHLIRSRYLEFLPKQDYPIRTGGTSKYSLWTIICPGLCWSIRRLGIFEFANGKS